jgi:hypothetical protein
VTGPAVTIAWTAAEAVLFGPESRLVRLPLAEDDDRPAIILETWRTEFPEIVRAQLLAGAEASLAPEAVRLAHIAAEAGLKLELAPPPGQPARRRGDRLRAWSRGILRPRTVGLIAVALAGLGLGGWRWMQVRERERIGKLTSAERQNELRKAESAATGRRREASTEQARALFAACTVPRSFAAEWLAAIAAAVPPSLVIDAIEISGARCRVLGHTVPGGPGVDTAVETLRQAIFPAAGGWTKALPPVPEFPPLSNPSRRGSPATPATKNGVVADGAARERSPSASPPISASTFRLEAMANPAPGAEPLEGIVQLAAAARARLPERIAVDALLAEWSPAWRIEAKGVETTQGVEKRRYALTALSRDARAWTDTLQVTGRLTSIAGCAIEAIALIASPGESGGLAQATVTVSLRLRRE